VHSHLKQISQGVHGFSLVSVDRRLGGLGLGLYGLGFPGLN